MKKVLSILTLIMVCVLGLSACSFPWHPRQDVETNPQGKPIATEAEKETEDQLADELFVPEAPKVIESKDIVSAKIEFDDSHGNHHLMSLSKEGDRVQVVIDDFMNHEDFEAPVKVLADLQRIIDKYDMASKNGYVSTTSGVPSGYGYELTVEYESGEYIKSYDNAFPGFTDEEGDALYSFLVNMEKIKWPEMYVASESLGEDGSWDILCTQFEEGENLSPEVSWEAVEGATQYAVFMYCPSLANVMTMRVMGIEDLQIPLGYAEEYRGMSHKTGTKRFELYVYALKAEPDTVPGEYGEINSYISAVERELDTSGGERGNILARGILKGKRSGSDR